MTIDFAAVSDQLARDGVAVVEGVLSPDEAAAALDALWAAAPESVARGVPAHIEELDPNAANVRVFDLIAIDHLFVDLIAHPVADRIVTDLLGPDYIVSNFTANIARPGSGSMGVHSDTALGAARAVAGTGEHEHHLVPHRRDAGERGDAAPARQPPVRASCRCATRPDARRWCRSERRPDRSW